MKRSLCVTAISLFLLLPALSYGDVTVQQDSCVTAGSVTRAYFTVFPPASGEFSICSMDFIPDPQPASSACTAVDCGAMPDWACWLHDLGGASYANPPYDNPWGCVTPAQGARGGFYITLEPGQCCYTVKFRNESLTVVHEQPVCFTCGTVPTDESSWGAIKSLYEE